MPREYQAVDAHNPNKLHMFRVYKDHHVAYNQSICGNVFYPRWVRINKKHGYYNYLDQAKKNPSKGRPVSKEELIQFLRDNRDWHTAILLVRAIEENEPDKFATWLAEGSSLRLFSMTSVVREEVYKYRPDFEDPDHTYPYDDDRMAIDTARCYIATGRKLS